jgi:tryptophanase
VQPTGGHAVYIDARAMLPHIPADQYPAWSLANALYLLGGVRGVEIGSVMFGLQPDGSERPAAMELVRLAFPRRVFTLSQVKFAEDRIKWLYANRELIGRLKFVEEPKVLRFFVGRLAPTGDWTQKLVAKFKKDFGDSL